MINFIKKFFQRGPCDHRFDRNTVIAHSMVECFGGPDVNEPECIHCHKTLKEIEIISK
jgi:hypothetical protein